MTMRITIKGLAAIALIASGVAHAAGPGPSVGPAPVAVHSGQCGATATSGSYVGPVANNTILPTQLSPSTTNQAETIVFRVTAPCGISDLQVASPGFYIGGSYLTEVPLAATYTQQCSVEYPVNSGSWTALKKNGSASPWTVAIGGLTYSDDTPLGFTIPNGASASLWCRQVGTSMPGWANPGNDPALYASGEGYNTGGSSTTTPKHETSTDSGKRYRSGAIVEIAARRHGDSIAIVGDSQVAYVSSTLTPADSVPASHDRGDIANALGQYFAYTNLGIGGDQWSTFCCASQPDVVALARHASTVVLEKNINEFNNKNAASAAIVLGWDQRIMPLFNGRKVIWTTTTPRTNPTSTTAVFTASASAGTMTVTAITSGTIVPGGSLSSSAAPQLLAYGTNGTTGTGGTGTYAINPAFGAQTWSSTSVTETYANYTANGSDQAAASYSTYLPTLAAGLQFGGAVVAPINRYAVFQNGSTANLWAASGAQAYYATRDGLHNSANSAYSLAGAYGKTWAAQVAAAAPLYYTTPITLTLSGTTFSGGYLTNGTVSTANTFPGNSVFTLVFRVVVPATHTGTFNIMPNGTNYAIKILTINASGQVVAINNGSATYATSGAINDGAEHEIAITDNGTTQTLFVDGTLVAGASYTHTTNGQPVLSLIASNTAGTAVSIRQLTVWNRVLWTANYTPALFSAPAANMVGLWPLSANGTGTAGYGIPQ